MKMFVKKKHVRRMCYNFTGFESNFFLSHILNHKASFEVNNLNVFCLSMSSSARMSFSQQKWSLHSLRDNRQNSPES